MQMFQLADTQLIQSPLNYTGGKYKLLPQILPLFPQGVNCFVDLFCGGCNVGINVEAKKIIYNDIDEHLLYLFKSITVLAIMIYLWYVKTVMIITTAKVVAELAPIIKSIF